MSTDQHMLTDQEIAQIREQVERELPAINSYSNPDLYASIGRDAMQRGVKGFTVRGVLKPEVVGRELVGTHQGIHDVVCRNKDTMGKFIDVTNVTSLVSLLAPLFGFVAAAVPVAIIALAVMLLRIGLDVYCHDHKPEERVL